MKRVHMRIKDFNVKKINSLLFQFVNKRAYESFQKKILTPSHGGSR